MAVATGSSLLGLLSGCPSVDLGEAPEDIGTCKPARGEAYFEAVIWPKFLATCTAAGCHDAGGQSELRFYAGDHVANYQATLGYLSCTDPMSSELLTKPLAGTVAHGGGDIFPNPTVEPVQAFLDWFTPPGS